MPNSSQNKTIWISCGGTGGHFMPGIVMGRRYEEEGYKVIYWGEGKLIEDNLAQAQKIDLQRPKAGSHRIVRLLKIWSMMFKESRKNKPEKCLLFGGFSSLALGVFSKFTFTPYYLFEQNVIPGRITRLFAKSAKTLFITFPESKKHLKNDNIQHTGNPVRLPPHEENKYDLLILGGSQGAQSLNTKLPQYLPKDLKVLHICGPGKKAECTKAYKQNSDTDYIILESHPNVPELIAQSSWIVSRAGATSLAEVAATQKALFTVPYPFAKDDHQKANAQYLEQLDAAICLYEDQTDLWADKISNSLADNSIQMNLEANISKSGIADLEGQQALKYLLKT